MASRLIVPFDNNPLSTTVRTTSYTIPAGRYAYVKTSSPNFSLNGLQLYPNETMSASAIGIGVQSIMSLTFPVSTYVYSASCSGIANGSSAYFGVGTPTSYQKTLQSRTSSGSFSPTFVSTTTIYAGVTSQANNQTSSISLSLYYFPTDSSNGFWVPAGSILNGNNYIVIEYNAIS